jgi:hypothetical protein
MSKINEKKLKEIIPNNNLPTLFIDGILVSVRRDKSFFVRLISHLPDGDHEEAKFMIQKDRLINFIDIFCEAAEYYPEKQKITKETK